MLKFLFTLLFVICSCSKIYLSEVSAMPHNALLIDVRSEEEFKSGHLPGAVNIPHTVIAEKISGVVPASDTPLYLYCRSGRRVGIAMQALKQKGYTVTVNLGGMEEARKAWAGRKQKIKLRVLMIGNSFSICVARSLPHIVRAGKKHHLELTSAYIGGCSLELHAKNLRLAAADPAFAPYRIDFWDSADLRKHSQHYGNVLELLKKNRYDIVTIQQASPQSWDFATYYPHAAEIIDCIKKYNPNATIMIQQTWSYRSDSPRLAGWKFDNVEMHKRIVRAYDAFAAATGFELIPTGEAIRIFRRESGRSYRGCTPEELAKLLPPDLPPMSGDVVGRDHWSKNKSGELVLVQDTIHLNFRGEYLQGCVWYGKLFGEDPRSIVFEPGNISRSECRLMRECAGKALKLF